MSRNSTPEIFQSNFCAAAKLDVENRRNSFAVLINIVQFRRRFSRQPKRRGRTVNARNFMEIQLTELNGISFEINKKFPKTSFESIVNAKHKAIFDDREIKS